MHITGKRRTRARITPPRQEASHHRQPPRRTATVKQTRCTIARAEAAPRRRRALASTAPRPARSPLSRAGVAASWWKRTTLLARMLLHLDVIITCRQKGCKKPVSKQKSVSARALCNPSPPACLQLIWPPCPANCFVDRPCTSPSGVRPLRGQAIRWPSWCASTIALCSSLPPCFLALCDRLHGAGSSLIDVIVDRDTNTSDAAVERRLIDRSGGTCRCAPAPPPRPGRTSGTARQRFFCKEGRL